MKTLALLAGILLLNASWYGQKQAESIPIVSEDDEIPSNRVTIVRGTIVEREVFDKAGQSKGFVLYFQISGDAYFIKFCESNVSRDELERHLDSLATSNLAEDNTIALEVEIREGFLICSRGGMMQQNVGGSYVVIHQIVESQTGN